ncbi:MAG: RagB/SusD family nutrient uptake outer membrane protein, partial [Pedobacter sp.]
TTDSRVGAFYFRQDGGIVLYAPSFELIATFDQVNDLRYPAYIKFDGAKVAPKSQYQVNKFIGGTASAPGLVDIKMFRTGEMYLIRAEAKAESTGDATADINALRTLRINNYMNTAFADKQALIDAVYAERFKELAFEGHRFFDLKRRNLSVTRIPADAANASGAVTLTSAQAQYSFPLPALEISVNKNTKQNPNY